jgi:hypothetical protein
MPKNTCGGASLSRCASVISLVWAYGRAQAVAKSNKFSASLCFKAAEAALGKNYGNHAYSVFSIGSRNNESELDAFE